MIDLSLATLYRLTFFKVNVSLILQDERSESGSKELQNFFYPYGESSIMNYVGQIFFHTSNQITSSQTGENICFL